MKGTLVPRSLDIDPDTPFVEVAVPRKTDEARAAMAAVDHLLAMGVSKRDLLVVAGNLDGYEPALTRAAIRRELTPTFWTQIDLTDTQLYRLLVGTCELLGADRLLSASTLQTVLAMGWVPPDPDGDAWPMIPSEVVSAFAGISPPTAKTLADWRDRFAADGCDGRILTLLDWLAHERSPTPDIVEAVLQGLVVRYHDHVLLKVKEADVPALLDSVTAARATNRLETLVGQVAAKYRARRTASRITASWTSVAGLIESVATQAPGRREHGNAREIDLIGPNDVWPRQVGYVIVVGLVEGEWPRAAESPIPSTLRRAINAGTDTAEPIVPRPAWTGGRAIDQFAEVIDAATEGVLLMRHTRTHAGETVPRSSLLETVPTTAADEQARKSLLRHTDVESAAVLDALDLPHPPDGDAE